MSNADAALRWPISRVAAALRAGALSSEALTAAALARAQARQPVLNAFIELRADDALAQARERDREAARGQWRGPLHGVPLAHKDCFERAGRTMTVGSRVLDAQPAAQRTATVIARLEAGGAVDLGPLNMNEMVAGPTGQNPHFGDCCNSVDPARISGGSSSGSGSAVGAGLVFASLGSDTGGSIRLPGSMNGLFALKPTYGRVSRTGCFPRAFSLDCVGPLARTAEDCALVLEAVAGADALDPSSAAAPVPPYAQWLAKAGEGSRIAVLGMNTDYDPQVLNAFSNLVRAAAARYGRVPQVAFDSLGACYAMADIMSKVEAATLHGQWMRERPERYSQAVYSRTEPGLHVPAVRYVESLNARAAILREFLGGPMAAADVLLCPTVPVPVPTRAEADMEAAGKVFGVVARLTPLTRPFNYLGVPVLTMPMGRDGNGMPMGAQLIGRPFGEARLLAVAQALAADIGWRPVVEGQSE
jgi:aspartyl-tRNA(Asn)/glutamyl-tRNA(Gln) amidotransferase subunit A